ncbi:MAG TPA: Rieske (2Fe-2S) protein [Bacteroidia bacterium]|jgi:cytochrome b6-f complex iron-sulfur subunit|nr:Rieske (2Fe-2S) protein [Bacteroidia bacterium]
MKTISRKEFIEQVGVGAAVLFVAACAGSCKKTSSASSGPANVNFTVDVSTGQLATNGGYIIQSGVIVARTSSGAFVAVSATCTHAGGQLGFTSSNIFQCPLHGATFNTSGAVISGPTSTNLQKYNTTLTGNSLRVYS